MRDFFAYEYDGPGFVLFGPGHLLALAIIATIIAYLIWGWRSPTEAGKQYVRWLLICGFLLVEVSYHSWNVIHGEWSIQTHLPLHLCSFSIWGSVYVLLTRDYRAYEIIYFIGIGGAMQAVLTPSAGIYGLPHFRAVETLTSHSLIIVSMVYMTSVMGFRPTWQSVWKSFVAINMLMIIVTCINLVIGGNYMYTLRKPDTASLFDFMGPWPWYLFWAEFMVVTIFVLLYLPFAIRDKAHGEAD